MKKGFMLMEVLVVIAVMPLVMVVISGIFVTFLRDVPRDTRLLEENIRLLDMAECLARDLDQAVALPASIGVFHSDDSVLLIALPDEAVCYQLQDGIVVRTVLGTDDPEDADAVRTWPLPNAVIAWQSRRAGEQAYAVELRTHLQQRVAGRTFDKFANSYLYFVNALGKGRESE